LPLGDGVVEGEWLQFNVRVVIQFTPDLLSRGLAEFSFILDDLFQVSDVVVHDWQGDADRDDGHDAEGDGRVGHEPVSLLPAIVLHFSLL
jgi:hypothetical protein